jgi:hypothetical protein
MEVFMSIKKSKDNSFKLSKITVVFNNHTLFAQFLRRFAGLDILKEIHPEDIEDINERHIPLFQENRDQEFVALCA